eukprot:Amastigsp_a214_209.p2 type:complete len:167 gc:universal Amastigsp_a214_209:548-48(-)
MASLAAAPREPADAPGGDVRSHAHSRGLHVHRRHRGAMGVDVRFRSREEWLFLLGAVDGRGRCGRRPLRLSDVPQTRGQVAEDRLALQVKAHEGRRTRGGLGRWLKSREEAADSGHVASEGERHEPPAQTPQDRRRHYAVSRRPLPGPAQRFLSLRLRCRGGVRST